MKYTIGAITVSGKDVVPKIGTCPAGYSTQGNYCVSTRESLQAIPKYGTCPPGYSTQGNYCVITRK